LILSGRLTPSINVAGLKVDPSEVEGVLVGFDAVAECVVVGTRDTSCGEVVKAVVVPRRQTTAREIQQFCRDRLASYKIPRYVVFLDELPRSASGKVLRKDLSDA
jgi:acyl-CoA synthetase (AMP-forming)/AMP-acid ligase II